MHTEHLQNVRPGRVVGGWLVAVAVTSIVVFGFVAVGLMGETGQRDTNWAVMAVALGFLAGGWFTGMRTLEAPILHGIGLGLTSLVAWAMLNLLTVALFRGAQWEGLSAGTTVAVLTAQITMAVAGCWIGTRQARLRAVWSAGGVEPGTGPDVGDGDAGRAH